MSKESLCLHLSQQANFAFLHDTSSLSFSILSVSYWNKWAEALCISFSVSMLAFAVLHDTLRFIICSWGPEYSLAVCWARCLACCTIMASILLGQYFFQWRGFFPWSIMGFDSIPPKLSCENINWGLVCYTCIPSHRLKRSWCSCPRWVNAGNKNTQHAPSTKTECDYLNGWIKKKDHIRKNLTQSGEPQRFSWGMQKKNHLHLVIQATYIAQVMGSLT